MSSEFISLRVTQAVHGGVCGYITAMLQIQLKISFRRPMSLVRSVNIINTHPASTNFLGKMHDQAWPLCLEVFPGGLKGHFRVY